MCGISGYAGWDHDEQLLRRMTEIIEHRGPDEDGFLVKDRVGLGVRRLSIIDVAGGQQPIFNEDGTIAIVFNGEIYNYRQLMADLEERGHQFATRTDTETIVHLYEEHGMECLRYLRGMFAFALYDARTERLFLARDRLGIKPLYYWAQDGKLLFGSEVKSLLESNEVQREPYLPAIDAYLSLRYVPGPETLFKGIRKIPAGHWMVYQNGQTQLVNYWQPQFHEGPYQPDEYYHERFAELFRETIQLHLESDVPLGAFLSGGVDSSSVVVTMRHLTAQPVKTFSLGFDWQGDELSVARQTAERLDCDHYEIICRPEDIGLLPQIIWNLDEPIGDAIVLPMFLLSKLAREHVKVVLTGEGGDEALAGYLFHKVMFWSGMYTAKVPTLLRQQLVRPLLRQTPAAVLNKAFAYPADLGERGRTKVLDYLDMLNEQQPMLEYRFLLSLFDQRDKQRLYNGFSSSINGSVLDPSYSRVPHSGQSYLNQLLALQYRDWLPDNMFMKADKTTMANSVEGRVPFMDHVLVEFLNQTPPHLKLRGLTDKVLLRDYLDKAFPGNLARQPKKPFYVPLERYFATPVFRELVNTCLSEEAVKKRGYFDGAAVRQLRDRVQGGDFLYGKQVLSLVMLELWHRIFIDNEPGWVAS